MQKNPLFRLFLFMILGWGVTLPLVLWVHTEKVYTYDIHDTPLSRTAFTSYFSPVASARAMPETIQYVQSGALTFDAPRTTIYISVSPDVAIERENDIVVEWRLDGERFTRTLDMDDAKMSASRWYFTFPFVAAPFTTIEYTITSRPVIHGSQIIVHSSDNSAYTTRLRLTPTEKRVDAAGIEVISRADWGANEWLRYVAESKVAKDREAYANRGNKPEVIFETNAEQLQREKSETMYSYARNVGSPFTETVTKTRTENGRKLVWPIETTRWVQSIIVHHTAESMQKDLDDLTLIRAIYQYHTVSLGWWDIGYNYLVWQRGKIYEGRAGWDYVVGAHAAWNNAGTVGISVMGDYTNMRLNRDQDAWLQSLIIFLAQKYGIDITATVPWVKICKSEGCGLFVDVTSPALLGHKDVGYTACPWVYLYDQIALYRTTLPYAIGTVKPVWNPRTPNIDPVAPEDEVFYTPKWSSTVLAPPSPPPTVPLAPKLSTRPPVANISLLPVPSVPKLPLGKSVRVKLSYPGSDAIMLQSAAKERVFLLVDKRRVLVPYSTSIAINISTWGLLEARLGTRKYRGASMTIDGSIVRIASWSRIPSWDSAWKYNDNIFRKKVIVRNENDRLLVVNELPVELYLRWMGEVSESDAVSVPEKAKTIIVGARSYALYYSDPTLSESLKKFPWKPYELSDDPDVSQKYLGYSYELRSPSVAGLVDDTNGEVVKYDGKIIKVWYSSSTDGRTRSYLEYCQASWKTDCEDIPYLQSVEDPGAVWSTRNGHGVWISGIGATYFARLWWEYKDIIMYYLSGVTIGK